jgi:hypothetical protein
MAGPFMSLRGVYRRSNLIIKEKARLLLPINRDRNDEVSRIAMAYSCLSLREVKRRSNLITQGKTGLQRSLQSLAMKYN